MIEARQLLEEHKRRIAIGAFDLVTPLSAGGMGVVWLAVHRVTQAPVAVKVVSEARADTERYRWAFLREVQAVAALRHPGIVEVLDYGRISQAAAEAGQEDGLGSLVADSPYLVMELAEGPSLRQWLHARTPSWGQVRDITFQLLDALAHAHARKVVHRDIKPANVLLFATQGDADLLSVGHDDGNNNDRSHRWKLTDFGLAHRQDHVRNRSTKSAGTPRYMAPEQFLGDEADYGPWTDLYGLGCLVWTLVTGHPPFDLRDVTSLMYHHLAEAAPALTARINVPVDLELWLRRLLAKDPGARFQCAADAAWALALVGRPVRVTVSSSAIPARSGAHEVLIETRTTPDHQRFFTEAEARSAAAAMEPSANAPAAAPVPASWHVDGPVGVIARRSGWTERTNVGAGLGLYGLRALPLVGRGVEQDRLWSALHAAATTRRGRTVVIRGAAGTGKTRLGLWLCRRARELGAATCFEAYHGDQNKQGEHLLQLVRDWLRVEGMEADELHERVAKVMKRAGATREVEWAPLARALDSHDKRARHPRHGQQSQIRQLIQALFVRLSRRRPVIVFLDDAHFAPDSMEFATAVQRAQRIAPCPIVVVVTVQEEALAERPVSRQRLATLLGAPGAEELVLSPLSPDSQRELVDGLLGLETALAEQVRLRTAGNPAFAVQLVGSWVERQILEPGKEGFRLVANARADMPGDLQLLWIARVEAALDGLDTKARISLEIAAALGNEVSTDVWAAACRIAGVVNDTRLVGRLVQRRLARWTPRGWAFVHGMLREAIEQLSRQAERWQEHHRTCLAALTELAGGNVSRDLAEAVGRHMAGSGDKAGAIEPLLIGAERRYDRGEYDATLMVLDDRRRLLDDIGAAPDDLRRVEASLLRAKVLRRRGLLNEAKAQLQEAARVAEDKAAWSFLVEAWLEESNVWFHLGHLDRARVMSEQAIQLGEEQHLSILVAYGRIGLADTARRIGELERAEQLERAALVTFERYGDVTGMGLAHHCLGELHQARGQLGEAREHFLKARSCHDAGDNRTYVANAENGLAEIDRLSGDLDSAEARYREVLAYFRAIGSTNAIVVAINLALTRIGRGAYSDAERLLRTMQERLVDAEEQVFTIHVLTGMLACLAAREAWAEWDDTFERARTTLEESRNMEPDDAIVVERAGDLCRVHGQGTRARNAYLFAAELWDTVDQTGRARMARDKAAGQR